MSFKKSHITPDIMRLLLRLGLESINYPTTYMSFETGTTYLKWIGSNGEAHRHPLQHTLGSLSEDEFNLIKIKVMMSCA